MYATQNKPQQDYTVWALIAVIAVIICALAGWMYARQDNPSYSDMSRLEAVAALDGQENGRRTGLTDGVKLGRKEANAEARAKRSIAQREAYASGRSAGFEQGRQNAAMRAGNPYYDTFSLSNFGSTYDPSFDTGFDDFDLGSYSYLGTGGYSGLSNYSHYSSFPPR